MIKLSFRDVIASENIKFWVSPEGKFFDWPSSGVFSRYDPHHEEKIHRLSGNTIHDLAGAHAAGWTSGGNIDRHLYLRPYNFPSALEAMQSIPSSSLSCDRLSIETETDGEVSLDTFGQNPRLVLTRYLRDKK